MNTNKLIQEQLKSLDHILGQDEFHDKEIDKAVTNIKQMTQEMKDELVAQLKAVTDELAMQLAIRFNEPRILDEREKNPTIKRAMDTIRKYENKEG